jgi:subtilisin family serine protease
MAQAAQFDPSLKQFLIRKTGDPLGEAAPSPVAGKEVSVVARLVDPSAPVPSLTIVCRFGHVVTGHVPLNQIVSVRRNSNVASLKASQPFVPSLAFSLAEIGASTEQLREAGEREVTGRGVLVGIVDWGCDFAHSNFRDEKGLTRLVALWDQRGGPQAESPDPFGYGREFHRDRINEALQNSDPYAVLGYDPANVDPGATGTHGTHVMDIAAGNGSAPGSAPGVAPQADLIFVHLKGEDTLPEDTLGDSVRVLEAVRYVFDRAGNQPAVVNLSLGRTGGPHDPTPLVVQGLDALVQERPGRAIVMSAGNYFEADLHSSGRLEPGTRTDLRWRVTPRNDETAEMEIWYSGPDTFGVELIDPTGRSLGRAGLGEDLVIREADRVLATIFHRRQDPNNGDNQVNIFLWPDAMIGTWITRLIGERITDGRYHAWIERDDPEFQSRFTPECATPTTTTGSICNGSQTIAVGAYDARDDARSILSFSSAGPTRDGRLKPDLSAPGVGIRAARSSPSGAQPRAMSGITTKSGTSMAAPHVTGTIALMFAAAGERRLSAQETREVLVKTARQSPPQAERERLRYGAGRVDTAAAVQAARSLRTLEPASSEKSAHTMETSLEVDIRKGAVLAEVRDEEASLSYSEAVHAGMESIPHLGSKDSREAKMPGNFRISAQPHITASRCSGCDASSPRHREWEADEPLAWLWGRTQPKTRMRESGVLAEDLVLPWLERENLVRLQQEAEAVHGWLAGSQREAEEDHRLERIAEEARLSEALRRLSFLLQENQPIAEDGAAPTHAELGLVASLKRVSVALAVDDGGTSDVAEFRRRAEDFANTYGAVGVLPDGRLIQGASVVAVFRNNDELIFAVRRVSDRLRAIGAGRSRIDTLAIFTHGVVRPGESYFKTGNSGMGGATPRHVTTQPSAGGPESGLMYKRRLSAEDFIRAVAPSLNENVRLILYACAVGTTVSSGEPAKADGGQNCLASRLAAALHANGIPGGEVWAHTNYAHTTCNPNWRRFRAAPIPPVGESFYNLVFDQPFRDEERRRLAVALPDGWFLDHTYLWYVGQTNLRTDAAGTYMPDGKYKKGAAAMHIPLDPDGFVTALRDRWRAGCSQWSNSAGRCIA